MATFGGFKLTLVSLIEAVKLVHLNWLVLVLKLTKPAKSQTLGAEFKSRKLCSRYCMSYPQNTAQTLVSDKARANKIHPKTLFKLLVLFFL